MLDVHAFRVPGLPGGEHPLPVNNLVSGVMALERLQAEMKLGRRAAAGLVLPVLQALIPLALASTPTVRGALGAWFRTGFGDLLADQPALGAALDRITYIEEAVMYTFGQYLADEKKESEARVLLDFIRQVWGDAEADRCARELEAAELRDLPNIADLMADQVAGRAPRLGANGRNQHRG